MARLRVDVIPSLAALGNECLDEITADGQTFATTGWFRLLDSLDLTCAIGGHVELKYVVASADGVAVAVCPLIHVAGAGAYFVYQLRRFFFEHWLEEAVRMSPERHSDLARKFAAVSAYRRFLEWTGAGLDECLLVVSPLSYRTVIPVSPSSPIARSEVFRVVVEYLREFGRVRRLPLWFLAVEGEQSPLHQALEAAGYRRVFLFFDNHIQLEQCASFDEYLARFRRTTRRAFQRDIRRTRNAGIEFIITDDLAQYSDCFTALYEQTYAKYGSSFLRHEPEFWRNLAQFLGDSTEATIAVRDERVIGFTVLLKSVRRGELWTYRIGRLSEVGEDEAPYYFDLSFYRPIQRAIELGLGRIWLGPASYEAKSVRGAIQTPLYSYFWFPRAIDRLLVVAYLQLFGAMSRRQIAESIHRPLCEPAPSAANPRAVST